MSLPHYGLFGDWNYSNDVIFHTDTYNPIEVIEQASIHITLLIKIQT